MKHTKIEAFENLVEAFQSLPSIGKKSAVRLAYHAVMEDGFGAMKLAHALETGVNTIQKCRKCHNMSEDELCAICSDPYRDTTKLCIVQSAKDILTIEESRQFNGVYYVVSEVSDMDEAHLFYAVEGVEEIIFAFPPSIATDTMILYIEDKLQGKEIVFTKIAQGVPTGVELENIDVMSLSRALESRVKI
ncbi:recombination mediator RecR [Sulfurovum mangrovi]|uniref:recombination mediator RecR n=1 Tax=Sulfurovum mangrovi TaxID=2893889 RepID=UPI001E4B2401|nr:recombination mediator RecR [Sulfurovum mangrovi]UFH58766.1 recombination mediator RecR [Sulfurovum mangrovi]